MHFGRVRSRGVRVPVGSGAITPGELRRAQPWRLLLAVLCLAVTSLGQAAEAAAQESSSVAGFVRDDSGAPIADASVTLDGAAFEPIITSDDGSFVFAGVAPGNYTVRASAGNCFEDASVVLVVAAAAEQVDLTLVQRADAYGYRCAPATYEFVRGDTQLTEVGGRFDSLQATDLPFAFPFYGTFYERVWVGIDGTASFLEHPYFAQYQPIPNPEIPNAAIYAFSADTAPRSGSVHVATLGSAPNRRFVIEWRGVVLVDSILPVTYEVMLFEDGRIKFQYLDRGNDPSQLGALASVGIENETGTVGHQYSYREPVLFPELAFIYEPPASALVAGGLLDANDGMAAPAAEIDVFQNGALLRTVLADATGAYAFTLPPGSYEFEARAPRYETQRFSLELAGGDRVARDLLLATAVVQLTPPALEVMIPSNQQREFSVELTNAGSAPLAFTLIEGGDISMMGPLPIPRAEPVLTAGAGEILTEFSTGWPEATVTFADTSVWVTEPEFGDTREFALDGTATGRSYQISDPNGAPTDSAYDRARGWNCHLYRSGDRGIHCHDLETGEEVAAIAGVFPWTEVDQYALAYRPDDDSFYVGGWRSRTIYHVSGFSDAEPGRLIDSCPDPRDATVGFAWNPTLGLLWSASATVVDLNDSFFAIDPATCTVLTSFPNPTPDFPLYTTGIDLDPNGNLWTVSLQETKVLQFRSPFPSYVDVPWLEVAPAGGELAAGAASALTFSFDPSGLSPGNYFATLFVETNAGREHTVYYPISLVVTEPVELYAQAVNVGGSAYTDAEGVEWAADRRYRPGSFGYLIPSFVERTWRTVRGTPDQALYRSQRVNPGAYRFDVPNGRYAVELHFAELDSLWWKRRIFDVLLENRVVLRSHDIAREVGTRHADRHSFVAEVRDGHIDVILLPSRGTSALPVLNAIRVSALSGGGPPTLH
jgi:hypothetical protein